MDLYNLVPDNIFSELATNPDQFTDVSENFRKAEEIIFKWMQDHGKTFIQDESKEVSDDFKEVGNKLTQSGKWREALVNYNKCLASSPLGHENVGVAYANRSVVYMKVGFYKTALQNIQLARQNGYPQAKLEKLAEREERCLNKIRTGESKEDIYEKHEDAKKKMLGETLPGNEKFPFYLADSLKLEKSDDFGYHIKTKEDLKAGTVVASERPVVATLFADKRFERCEYCKTRNLSKLIPCNSCTRVVYCSEKCRQEAFEGYHKYFCGIESSLTEQISAMLKLFCFGLNCFEGPTEFAKFLRETEDSDVTGWDVDFRGMDQKETDKNLFLIMNSFKNTFSSKPQSEKINSYKQLAFILTAILNFSKLKDVLVTEDDKAMLRNFLFKQTKLLPHYYPIVHFLSRYEPVFDQVCRGVLSLTNFFNNSCAPNVRMFLDDSKVRFVTLRPIKKGDQLCIGYGPSFQNIPVEARRVVLLQGLGFVCRCEACEKPHQYSLSANFEVKDPGAFCHSLKPQFEKEMMKLNNDNDVDAAMKLFRLACDYLDTVFPRKKLNEFE